MELVASKAGSVEARGWGCDHRWLADLLGDEGGAGRPLCTVLKAVTRA